MPGPGYYAVTLRPGQGTTLYAIVGSVGPRPPGIVIAAVDARSGVYGGVSYDLPTRRPQHVGSWITLSRRWVHPATGTAVIVPFTVRVPTKARARQYVGGITAYVPAQPAGGSRKRGRAGAITLQLRTVVAVVVTVPGALHPRFSIVGVGAALRPDGMYIVARIRNSGTVLLKGTGHLWVWAPHVRRPVIAVPLALDTVVPHTGVAYPIYWAKHPGPGRYGYNIVVQWSGGMARQRGAFTIR